MNEIDSEIVKLKYGDEQKEINKLRKNKNNNEIEPKFHKETYIEYPELAILKYGGEYPRNISMLNADRSGKLFLFSSQPPVWQSQFKPPIYKKSLFDYLSLQSTQNNLQFLVDFLIRFERLELSIKDPERDKHLQRWVNQIADNFLFYAGNIQKLPAGWTDNEEIKLKIEHQLFLDPFRKDPAFQAMYQDNAWQRVICIDFAHWLNRKLTAKNKQFTPQAVHTDLWFKHLEPLLREHTDLIKSQLKKKTEENA